MAPRKTKPKEDTALLAALKFVQVAQAEIGTPYQTHCRFINGYVTAFNGVLAAGHPVADEMAICPHTYRLIDALSRAQGAYSLTALDNKVLVLKTDKFKAPISCIGDGDLTYIQPDPAQWPMNDDFKQAAIVASLFNTEGAQTVMAASVCTRDGSIIGTQGNVVIEAWHGIPTPPGLIIPKTFINALAKVNYKLERFGFTNETLTVWFEGGAFLKTQLYLERYPNVDLVLAYTETAKPVDVTPDLFDAIRAIAGFGTGPRIYLGGQKVRSHFKEESAATYECKSAVIDVSLNGKHLLALEPYIKSLDYGGNEKVVVFFGDKLRGALAKYVSIDDDIPF